MRALPAVAAATDLSIVPPVADGLPTPARYRAMAAIIVGITLSVLDSGLLQLALPALAREFHAAPSQVVWVVNAYQVAVLAVLLPAALLGDLVGYRKVYVGGLLLFTAASLACALADSLPLLTLARALQGLGAAGLMSVNAALVRLVYPRHLLGRGIAINSMVVATASVAGPPVAALLLSLTSWHWLFAINLPLGALVLWLSRALPASAGARPPGARLPRLDAALNVLSFGLVFLGASALAGRSGPQMAGAAGLLLACGLAAGAVYLRRQWRQPLPLFPLDLLRIPVFRLSMCTSLGAFSAQMLAYLALPFLLLEGHGFSHADAGLVLSVWPLAIACVAPLVGRQIGRWPAGALGGAGLALLALGLAALALLPAQPTVLDVAWRLALCGVGFGLFQSPNNHTIVTTPPPHRIGSASGMLGTARLSGQSLAAVTMAGLFHALPGGAGGRAPVAALALAAAAAAVGSVFSLRRLRHPPARPGGG